MDIDVIITLHIKDQKISLTLQELKELKNKINNILNEEHMYIPYTPAAPTPPDPWTTGNPPIVTYQGESGEQKTI